MPRPGVERLRRVFPHVAQMFEYERAEDSEYNGGQQAAQIEENYSLEIVHYHRNHKVRLRTKDPIGKH